MKMLMARVPTANALLAPWRNCPVAGMPSGPSPPCGLTSTPASMRRKP
jgi:hypothetical protein